MNKARNALSLLTACISFFSCSIIPIDSPKPDIKDVLLKENLKVLDIGNSYTNDATFCLPYIVERLGVDVSDMCLYKATCGGASFKTWHNIYYDKDSVYYEVKRVVGGLASSIDEDQAEPFDGSLFRSLLTDEKWDIILIHQLGRYSTLYEEWFTESDAGYLDKLIDIIKSNQPQCKIGYLFTHSSSSGYPTNIEHSSRQRWENSVEAINKLVQEYDIAPVLPYGTAIQNLRASGLNNENDLTRDGSHLGHGLAQYTAACCYYETLIAPRTGISILLKNIEYYVKENPTVSQISVTRENMLTAQKAAVLACRFPFLCINPDLLQN